MKHDFDKVIDRRNTNSVKYDFTAECGMPEDVLPLWVADMDFQAPEAVRQRLAEISRFGIYGYSNSRDDYFAAVQKWYSTHFSWKPKKNGSSKLQELCSPSRQRSVRSLSREMES